MTDFCQKAELPPSRLGNNRCFQIKYYGHGDIATALWKGTLDNDVRSADPDTEVFNWHHGNDETILAALAGFLTRSGVSKPDIANIMLGSGSSVLQEFDQIERRMLPANERSIDRIAIGEPLSRFDLKSLGLRCLVLPTPSQPGVFEYTGGTGIYTKATNIRDDTMVWASFNPQPGADLHNITPDHTAEFCVSDVPTMAKLVCDLSLGEYRRDIAAFLQRNYLESEQ